MAAAMRTRDDTNINWQAKSIKSIIKHLQLVPLRQDYRIPHDVLLVAPKPNDRPFNPRDKKMAAFSTPAFHCGLRLPLHPFFRKVLSAYNLAPYQLHPNGWAQLVGSYLLWAEHSGGEEMPVGVFLTLYRLKCNKVSGFYHLNPTSQYLVTNTESSINRWKESWFWAGEEFQKVVDDSQPDLEVPLVFSTPGKHPGRCHLNEADLSIIAAICNSSPKSRSFSQILGKEDLLVKYGLMASNEDYQKGLKPRPTIKAKDTERRFTNPGSLEDQIIKRQLLDKLRKTKEQVENPKLIPIKDLCRASSERTDENILEDGKLGSITTLPCVSVTTRKRAHAPALPVGDLILHSKKRKKVVEPAGPQEIVRTPVKVRESQSDLAAGQRKASAAFVEASLEDRFNSAANTAEGRSRFEIASTKPEGEVVALERADDTEDEVVLGRRESEEPMEEGPCSGQGLNAEIAEKAQMGEWIGKKLLGYSGPEVAKEKLAPLDYVSRIGAASLHRYVDPETLAVMKKSHARELAEVVTACLSRATFISHELIYKVASMLREQDQLRASATAPDNWAEQLQEEQVKAQSTCEEYDKVFQDLQESEQNVRELTKKVDVARADYDLAKTALASRNKLLEEKEKSLEKATQELAKVAVKERELRITLDNVRKAHQDELSSVHDLYRESMKKKVEEAREQVSQEFCEEQAKLEVELEAAKKATEAAASTDKVQLENALLRGRLEEFEEKAKNWEDSYLKDFHKSDLFQRIADHYCFSGQKEVIDAVKDHYPCLDFSDMKEKFPEWEEGEDEEETTEDAKTGGGKQ